MEGPPENLPELKEPCPICLLTKVTKISRGPTTDVSKFAPSFMLQMNFAFFSVESIRGFTSTSVDICSATSYPFGLPSRNKSLRIDILKFLVTTLRNQEKKVAVIRVDEDGALARSSEYMMFMLWHVLINSGDMASAPSSSTLMNATFLS